MKDDSGRGLRNGAVKDGCRIVLYSHDTLGFGHLRRNLLLATALGRITPRPDILLIAGMSEAGRFDLPEGTDMLTLPAYGKNADGSYQARHLGLDLRSLTQLRARTIEAALSAYDPDLLIVDNVPRGCQAELDPALAMLRRRGRAHVVLGLRDIIDSPEKVRAQWLRQRNRQALRHWFDEIWIYGDQNFFDLPREYGFGDDFAARARFMGYLDQRHRLPHGGATAVPVPARGGAPYVLCAVGGGKDGAALCRAFAQARLPEGHRGIILTGTQMPGPEQQEIARLIAARPEMDLHRFLPEPLPLLAGAARVVAMGGYNTVCEALSLGKRPLIVPRTRPRREQVIRAERLSRQGAIDMLLPEDLTAAALSDWLSRPAPPPRAMLDLSGIERVRRRAAEILAIPSLSLAVSA